MKQSIIALDINISAQDAKINHDFAIMKQSIEALGSKVSSFLEILVYLIAVIIMLIMYQTVNLLCNPKLGQLTHKYSVKIYLRQSRQQLLTALKKQRRDDRYQQSIVVYGLHESKDDLKQAKKVFNAMECESGVE